MEPINFGGQEEVGARDICVLCDYKPDVIQRPDVCTCCDATDWSEKDPPN